MLERLVEGGTLLNDGRYQYQKCIGSGSFAVIIRAFDLLKSCPVAIKCMRDPKYNTLGEQEAVIIRHVNAIDKHDTCAIVRLLATFTEANHFCIVLELLQDPILNVALWDTQKDPLAQAIAKQKLHSVTLQLPKREKAISFPSASPLPMHEIRHIAVHLCGALAFLHAQNIIHADIKPENILRVISPDPGQGAVKIVDFGNSIMMSKLQDGDDGQLSENGFEVQTPAYRAPEVAAGVELTPAMDMWSLGCVLVECMSGKPLFPFVQDDGVPVPATNTELLRQVQQILFQKNVKDQDMGKPVLSNQPPPESFVPTLRQHLWKCHVNDPFVDFVNALLTVNPDSRMTAKNALLHPFLQKIFPFQLIFSTDSLSTEFSSHSSTHITEVKTQESEQSSNEAEKIGYDNADRPMLSVRSQRKRKNERKYQDEFYNKKIHR